jgi:SAM-dependent methyltransferase
VTGRFSFEVVDAVDYDELRPSYAPEAVEWVAQRGSLREGSIVVDLAAGTGQLSRRFADLGVDLVAVEPATNMRAVLEERLPAIRVVDGTAEELPFPGGSVDAVVVGNAFHHFERRTAFAEIHRILRPGGVLALFWAWPLEDEQRSIPGRGRSTRPRTRPDAPARSRSPTAHGRIHRRTRMGSVRSSDKSSG